MKFPEAVKSFFTNYVNFKGRARRSEFWYSYLFLFLVNLAARVLDHLIFDNDFSGRGVISLLVTLATIIPFIAVSIRRLHDTGKAGWWFLFILIPIVGPILLLIFWAKDSEGPNQWGAAPKFAGTNPQNPYYA